MKKYDLAVIGGGFAGVAAALAAARGGAKVLIIEKSNCLGGAAVNCLVNPFMPYWTEIDGRRVDLSAGIFKEIRDRLEANHAMSGKSFLEEELKYILNEMVIDAHIDLLFHAYIYTAEKLDKDIFIDGWFERKFLHKPLWKSKMHFFHCFSEVLYNINIPIEEQKQNNADTYLKKVREKRINAICDTKCKEVVLDALQLEEDDIIQKTIHPKIRKINPNEIHVSLGDEIRNFSELTHDSFTVLGDLSIFCYWYVNLDKVQGNDNADRRKKVIAEIIKYTQGIF